MRTNSTETFIGITSSSTVNGSMTNSTSLSMLHTDRFLRMHFGFLECSAGKFVLEIIVHYKLAFVLQRFYSFYGFKFAEINPVMLIAENFLRTCWYENELGNWYFFRDC